ncbi:type I-B CRISPR-associated protein Cas7/Cst2/DevR [Candidatus Desulforudis audaxviator]|uniref:CRISPR-associated autoregulator, DevR family n=1 Tax=Desulforudis audaxviator (strain MP104C) TaxID=477974 RepID=B1I4N4_DESAP|nr:type I-B CRISPR-associated protein Cas7/Cst2/DevR [Candidatus Desulforudis audaxviator]ACA59803.1 CRISPR-associated autoregulator, DevR family [Candidatus Desulforudis audaxviator MP104C]
MAFLAGLLVLDAPASALNNAGADAGARTDNTIAVKKIRTPQGVLPYVSAQAFRYWLRTGLETSGGDWVAAPVFREGKIAYTDANPVRNWDDDLFGYMRAPSKKTDAVKAKETTPLEKDREITRVSPFRVGTFVAIAPSPIVSDFGTMTRQDGDPVPHEHEFYRAHLRGLFSLDLTCAGTFFDSERVGYKNLDTYRREEAQNEGCREVKVRKQMALRLPIEKRCQRVSTLVRALAELSGGAKQALHYTDLVPAIVFLAVVKNGNNPFYRALRASKTHQTEFDREAFAEILRVYKEDFLSDIHIGWAKGFLDEERQALQDAIVAAASSLTIHLQHPREAIQAMADKLADSDNEAWYE